jgi:hypothetical protein
LGEQLAIAHVATAARDLKGDDYTVTDREIRNATADFTDDAHRFVPENVTGVHEGAEYLVKV